MSLLQFEWRLPGGVHAAFTTRAGGASAAPWDSFNVAAHVGDAPADVAANRTRLKELLTLPAEPSWLNQVHGVAVSDLDRAPAVIPQTADAAVASIAGRVCVVMVADCLPVLFASRDGKRIAAAHAGWRGLVAGVLERTVAALRVPGAQLTAWLGPAISRQNFEVGEDVRAAFGASDTGVAAAFEPNARGRWQADLTALARRRLAALGVTDISGGEWCTFADRERFYSHRRDGHLHSGMGGRMAALIWRD
ncbi:MAG TPA: peptidoglycan editing factor PgeF [Steroidobacteraceae bacterium]|jgi:YfiH family protein|nr:peptidoglycan editing factor PgeF [Steroidobacteraceae bacterium]